MFTQCVWKPIRDQSKLKSNTWKLSKLKTYWVVTIKNSTNVFKLGDYAQFLAHHDYINPARSPHRTNSIDYRLKTDSILLQ